jgi:hypothetical protein
LYKSWNATNFISKAIALQTITVIGAEEPEQSGRTTNRLPEHATKRLTIHHASMDSKPDDAVGVVVHHMWFPIAME